MGSGGTSNNKQKKNKQKTSVLTDFVRYLAIIITNTSPGMGCFVHAFPFYSPLLSSFEYEIKYQRETTIVFVRMLMAVTPDD